MPLQHFQPFLLLNTDSSVSSLALARSGLGDSQGPHLLPPLWMGQRRWAEQQGLGLLGPLERNTTDRVAHKLDLFLTGPEARCPRSGCQYVRV